MPPFTDEGATICVYYLWWGLICKWCAEAEGNCQARSGTPREKRKDAIQAMREEDETYKEWLEYKEECSGETTGVANRNTTKQKEKKTAGMQSRVDKTENRMKEADSQMGKLERENRKLRKTPRSKSPHPSRRRKEASDDEEEEEEEPEGESDNFDESDDTEPMSSEEERPPRRSKSKEGGRTASRRMAKETKPKGRSQRMMSVQRTDSEGDDSFEERGELEEDFASSEKLVVEIDQEFKDLLDETRAALLANIDKLKDVLDGAGGWFDETGSLGVENQVKGTIRDLEKQILNIDVNLMKLANNQQEREQKGTLESKLESDGSSLNENE